jgi:hypothetical protein
MAVGVGLLCYEVVRKEIMRALLTKNMQGRCRCGEQLWSGHSFSGRVALIFRVFLFITQVFNAFIAYLFKGPARHP